MKDQPNKSSDNVVAFPQRRAPTPAEATIDPKMRALALAKLGMIAGASAPPAAAPAVKPQTALDILDDDNWPALDPTQ